VSVNGHGQCEELRTRNHIPDDEDDIEEEDIDEDDEDDIDEDDDIPP